MKIKDLSPNAKNPRKISDAKLAMLRKSLAEFGDLSGIIYNRKTKQLVGGHQRREVFDPDTVVTVVKKYSKPTKTGTVLDGFVEVNGERFTYREVYWDEHKEMAANIAANKGAGEWDLPQLTEWMKELSSFDVNFDMDLTMFDPDEIKAFAGIEVAGYTRTGPTGKDEDDVPEVVPPRTKTGDVYLLGQHRLLCGDATRAQDIAKLMGSDLADMVWTDPPYNVAYEGKTKDALKISNDEMSGEKFYQFLFDAYKNMLTHTKPGGAIYVAHADTEGMNFRKAMTESGWLLKQCLVWVKQALVMGRQDYHWRHEPILYGWAPKGPHKWFSDRKQTTVLEFNRPARNGEHPTMKPVELIQYCLENSSALGALVLDIFGGSGSTMIACEKLNRRAALVELEPRYCDVIVKRWEDYTGLKAELVRTETKTRKAAKQGTSREASV